MRIPPAAPDASFAQLVLDDDSPRVRRFRSTTQLPPMPGVDLEGLAELSCSGSAQFSAAAWRELQARLGLPPERLYVIDLRQESHGFLNEAAVSWYAWKNWGCAGLSDEQALALEALRLELLARSDVIQLGRVEDIKSGAPRLLSEWPRRSVCDERQLLGLPEGHYVRLPVTDHTRPGDAVVERFVQLTRRLGEREHLHIHCRGGKGRTSTLMALWDMLRNASRCPYAVILERQRQLSDYDLSKPPDPASSKASCLHERSRFLEQFYEYARHNPGGAPRSWEQWLGAS